MEATSKLREQLRKERAKARIANIQLRRERVKSKRLQVEVASLRAQ